MKKVVLTALAMTCAASIFAQGTVVFNNRVTGTLITHVYGGAGALVGNGANDTPAAATSYTGYTAIGANGLAGLYGASTTFAQLLALPGANQAEASLIPSSGTTTFRTGGAAGNVAGLTATLSNVPADTAAATLEMVAWDNSSGLYPTWTQAEVAWKANLIAAGKSGAFTVNAIGGQANPAPFLTGLQSFSIYMVPEPSTMALAGLGAAALLIFRRRK